jgi:hypothetical protein
VTNSDAVVVVAKDIIDRSPEIIEKPNSIDPDQKQDNECGEQAKSQTPSKHNLG